MAYPIPTEGSDAKTLYAEAMFFYKELAEKDKEISALHQALLERCKYGHTYGCDEHSHDICVGCPLPKK